jgi:hypothetical protein
MFVFLLLVVLSSFTLRREQKIHHLQVPRFSLPRRSYLTMLSDEGIPGIGFDAGISICLFNQFIEDLGDCLNRFTNYLLFCINVFTFMITDHYNFLVYVYQIKLYLNIFLLLHILSSSKLCR